MHNACDPNKLNHIFGKEVHKLSSLVSKLGSEQAAFDAVESAVQQQLAGSGTTGVFQQSVVVAGENLTVRGAVVNGVARVGSFWVP